MSITARGAPGAATVPATRTVCDPCGPACSCSCAGPLPSVGRPRACKAAALRKHGGRRQQASRSLPGKGAGHERGRHGGQQQRIGPPPAARSGRVRARVPAGAVAGGVAGCVVHPPGPWWTAPAQGLARATCGWLASCGIQRFGQRALHGAQLQVGLAVHGAHGLRKLIEGRGVDHMHGKGQRHAQHHGGHCGGAAPGVVAQVLPGEGAKQCKHGGDCDGPAQTGQAIETDQTQPQRLLKSGRTLFVCWTWGWCSSLPARLSNPYVQELHHEFSGYTWQFVR
jgi:hypothetical protein